MINITDFSDQYFYVFSDCFITNGIKRISILDISRKKIHFLNADYLDLFEMMAKEKIGKIIACLDTDKDIGYFSAFIQKLMNLDLGMFVDDISLFPPIEIKWETPSWITNAIIDIRHISHDFEMIANELNRCRCKHVEIRSYEILEISNIQTIISSFKEKSFLSVNLITKYDEDKDYLKKIMTFTKNNTLFHLTFHGVPKEKVENFITNRINVISGFLDSSQCCGKISKNSFLLPSIQLFMENQLYNGCLNKKISIDENGEIKNCPSMKRSFGNIRDTSIFEVAQNEDFQKIWSINKSQIKVCKDCEYRCICTDCRAYIENPDDIFSKPVKCSYNPNTLKW